MHLSFGLLSLAALRSSYARLFPSVPWCTLFSLWCPSGAEHGRRQGGRHLCAPSPWSHPRESSVFRAAPQQQGPELVLAGRGSVAPSDNACDRGAARAGQSNLSITIAFRWQRLSAPRQTTHSLSFGDPFVNVRCVPRTCAVYGWCAHVCGAPLGDPSLAAVTFLYAPREQW